MASQYIEAVSLWQIMKNFDAWGIALLLRRMCEIDRAVQLRMHDGERDEMIPDDFAEAYSVKQLVPIALHHAEEANLESTHNRVCNMGPFSLAMWGPSLTITFGELHNHITVLRECIEADLEKRYFLFIPPGKIDLGAELHDGGGRWQFIWKQFKSVEYDSKEAVKCFVADRYTACVFHSMMIAEYGLRALAKRMKVKLPKHKRLEWSEWQDMLREMTRISEQVASKKGGPKRDELLEFYRGALGQFYAFKDEYRNQVMHARKHYDEFQATSALNHVKDFMEKLAARIDEKGRTIKA